MDSLKKQSWKLPTKIDKFENVLFNEAEKDLPSHLRIHCVKRLEMLYSPLSFQVELITLVECLIWEGYKGRNPYSTNNILKFRQDRFLDFYQNEKLTASGGTLIGVSGMGKSVSVQHALSSLTQVLHLEDEFKYKVPLSQLVWLNIDCIHDGSFRGLCNLIVNNVDYVLQTEYASLLPKKCSTERLATFTAKILRLHGLGLLVIDEIQHLLQASEQEQTKALQFLSQLVNNIGIPVLLIGTPKAYELVYKKFIPSVRSSCKKNLVWNRVEQGYDWNKLVETLLRFQWTIETVPFSSEIVCVLYQESIGIPWVAVKSYILAQQRAINLDMPRITPELIRAVIRENLKLIQPMLDAVKSEENSYSCEVSDLIIPNLA
ncbi:Transposon Tn7 transposition protein TnsC [Sporomusa rhizae]|uniref:ATP-binding protein n=1 Tax=Sporomusa rhizae TaxID=357999 RepID=UPI00352A00EE